MDLASVSQVVARRARGRRDEPRPERCVVLVAAERLHVEAVEQVGRATAASVSAAASRTGINNLGALQDGVNAFLV